MTTQTAATTTLPAGAPQTRDDMLAMHRLIRLLRDEKRFCNWGAPAGVSVGDKVPLYPHGDKPMAWKDPARWSTAPQAIAGIIHGQRAGIGIFTTNGDHPALTPLTCIDLDDCLRDGVIVGDWQRAVVDVANTLTEISPSGRGLHLWFRGAPGFTPPDIGAMLGGVKRGFEVFNKAHHVRLSWHFWRDVDPAELTAELWARIIALVPASMSADIPGDAVIEPRPSAHAQHTRDQAGTVPARDVVDEYDRRHKIADVLRARGYTVAADGKTFCRPGKSASEGHSGTIHADGKAFTFSPNDPMFGRGTARDAGTVFGPFDVLRELECAGDRKRALDEARARLGIESFKPTRQAAPAAGAPPRPPTSADSDTLSDAQECVLPRIRANGRELRSVSSDAMNALASMGGVFVRSGVLVRVALDEKGAASVELLSEHALRGLLARAADFFTFKVKADGTTIETPVAPPIDVVRDILSLGTWPFPAIEGVVESPAMRPDGSVIERPGYDPATRLFYCPRDGFEMPAIQPNPTPADVAAALTLLRDAFVDFPFDGDASRDNALALLVSIPTRTMYDIAPICAVDAPQQGVGKTKLCANTVLLTTGALPTMGTAPDDPEEWRKRISSQLAAGRSVVIFDNVTRTLENDALASATTSETWEDRALGSNVMLKLPSRAVWMVTGNNIRVGGDMASRCYLIRLDAKTSNPQERTGFKHEDLEGYIRSNRGLLLAAVLTICRAWVQAGRPKPSRCPVMRHTQWRNVVGGILEYAGVTSLLANQAEFYLSADDEGPVWEAFIAKMVSVFGNSEVSAGMIYERAMATPDVADTIPADLAPFLTESGKAKFAARMGFALKARKGKRFGVHQARCEASQNRMNGTRWRFYVETTGRS